MPFQIDSPDGDTVGSKLHWHKLSAAAADERLSTFSIGVTRILSGGGFTFFLTKLTTFLVGTSKTTNSSS